MNSPPGNIPLRPLGSTGLLCHPLGFGGYRIADDNEEHEAALRSYLERGGTLIDTSSNYTDGQSEIVVGKVLKSVPQGRAIVVTKAGYIQGQNMTLAQAQAFPEIVKYGEGIWHCIHPEFLETQIARSSQRLRLDCLDVFLLHNPEYFLRHQSHHKELEPADHEEFYRRVGQAFRFLEEQVRAGKIRWYGISSNNFGLPLSDPEMTSVQRCLAEAEKVAKDHHFRVIQLPLNLFESGGALERNNEGRTVLEFCREHGLGVLVNRPLNAFYHNQLIRLADFAKPGQSLPDRDRLVNLLAPLEAHEQALVHELNIAPLGSQHDSLSGLLRQIVPRVRSVEHWEQALSRYVIAPLQQWIETTGQKYASQPAWSAWLQKFFPLLYSTFEEVEDFVQAQQQSISDEVRRKLWQAGYPKDDSSLSQIAISLLTNLDGLSCVLVGMRRVAYVADAFGSLNLSGFDARDVLSKFTPPVPRDN